MDTRGNRNNIYTVPPRWLHCPRKAATLVAGKFLAFKTPLSTNYDDQIPEECRFTPAMVFASMNSYKVKIGLWIDLTNTNRFYDKKDVETTGSGYVKLQCRGHGECPSEEQTRAFVEICSNFIANNPVDCIGIHCTHGFNRTGFLIISYMVENMDWSLEAAIQAFRQARQPGIYKKDYLEELVTRYGDDGCEVVPPVLPDWHTECDDSVDDDGNNHDSRKHSEKPSPGRRRKEFQKKNPTFMDGVQGVTAVTTQPKLVQIQRKCQHMCEWKGNGFPGSQPVSMDCKNLHLLRDMPYKVSWKADGTRYMMLIDGENQVYFIDRDNCAFQVSSLRFPRRKQPGGHISDTLLDGEMVIDSVNSQPVPRFLVYDIVKFEGLDVGKTDFDRRMLCIDKEIVQPRYQAIQDGRINKTTEPFSVRIKPFYEVMATKDLLGDKFTQQLSHEIDGLIFQPSKVPYVPGRCNEVLKWKPPSLNSVDFKLSIRKEHKTGMMPEVIGQLFVGNYTMPFQNIKLNKELKKLDNKIIECAYADGQWKFLRERTDKSFPNSHATAMAVCESIKNPVTKEVLLEFIARNRHQPSTAKRPYEGSEFEPAFKKPV